MSYSYSPRFGSLATLEAQFGPDPDVDDREAIAEVLDETWVEPSTPDSYWVSELDWHRIDEVSDLADQRVSREAGSLVSAMFSYAPFGLPPDGFGYVGCLEHAEVVQLRDALESDAERPADLVLVQVLLTLRTVPAGSDVALLLARAVPPAPRRHGRA